MASLPSIIAWVAYHLLYQKMKDERGKRKEETRHSTERMRGLESLTVYSECRDAIHRMINHALWHDVLMYGDKIRITSLNRNFNPPQGWLLIAHALHKLNVFCFCRDWEIQEER